MKYKIKNTGEIIEVIQCDIDGNNIIYTDVKGCGNNPYLNLYKDCFPIFEDNIDWEQRKFDAAKAAMQGLCAVNDKGSFADVNEFYKRTVMHAINIADELIKQLKNNEAK